MRDHRCTTEDGRAGTGWRNTNAPPIVAVAVGQQAQAGRRTHFDQGERLRQRGQQGQQRAQRAGSLVWVVRLSIMPRSSSARLRSVDRQRNIGWPPGNQGCGPQKQVRLASRRRQFDQEARGHRPKPRCPLPGAHSAARLPGLRRPRIGDSASPDGPAPLIRLLSHPIDHAKARPPRSPPRPPPPTSSPSPRGSLA